MSAEQKIPTVEAYSLASYYVETLFNDLILSNGTCFFKKHNNQLFLITNWHVVSGRNADTKKILHSDAAIPNKLRVYLYNSPNPKADNIIIENTIPFEVPLYDEQENKLWAESELNDMMIDVIALPIHIPDTFYCLSIDDAEEPFNEDTELKIADDIYILGFPFGTLGGMNPIWKRASVASEPEININNMPFFFADTASRSGMSGSPVVLYQKRPVFIYSESEKKGSRHYTKLVGIYSGRIGSEQENSAQLGRVWKAYIIDSLISSLTNATPPN